MDERVSNIIKFHTKLINGHYTDFQRQCSEKEYKEGKRERIKWLKWFKKKNIK